MLNRKQQPKLAKRSRFLVRERSIRSTVAILAQRPECRSRGRNFNLALKLESRLQVRFANVLVFGDARRGS
jgi:hypothetical protein